MSPDELFFALFPTIAEHLKLPAGYGWAPPVVFALVTALGLLLLVRGARWAPGLAALTFLAAGGWVGSFLAGAIGTPVWPTVGVVGVVGLVLGFVLFRLWQAALLASCFVIAALSVYYVRTLTPEVQNWVSASAEPGFVTLQPPDTVVGDHRLNTWAELGSLWTHLNQHVPSFATTFWALTLSAGLAGLVFGLLLPHASRALWAASLGTAVFGIGTTALLKQYAPGALDWLLADAVRAWAIVAVVISPPQQSSMVMIMPKA